MRPRGWLVFHNATTAYTHTNTGTPSIQGGYHISSSYIYSIPVTDFYFEVPGIWKKHFDDVVAYGTLATRPTIADLFDGTHSQGWNCPTNTANCHITTLSDGVSWGLWDTSGSGCCLSDGPGGGLWIFSAQNSPSENYGICRGGYTHGVIVDVASGCTTGDHTRVPTDTLVYMIAVRY